MKKDCNICILGGGWSNEREISLKSSRDVFNTLLENKHNVVLYDMKKDSYDDLRSFLHSNSIDLVFNLVHGEGGEDGKIQSYLEDLDIKYCGSNSNSSSLSFNKFKTKKIWRENNLITPDFEIYSDQSYDELTKIYGDTFFIKDTCSGSSNNIYQIKNNTDFESFTKNKKNREFMIERKITSDEYTAAILNNNVLPIIKIIPSNEFYDFDAKYQSNETKFLFPDLSPEMVNAICEQVMRAFNALGCKTWARVDFFVQDDLVILLEINTIPGMTDHSLVPKAANKHGLSYYQLVLEIMGIDA
ncbi:MAG: D-alanine--D-alanine ligase [Pseudomonadota bacterium]|nr:D-alanine--D-alanine ligase [Pseudomonadota bacterium]